MHLVVPCEGKKMDVEVNLDAPRPAAGFRHNVWPHACPSPSALRGVAHTDALRLDYGHASRQRRKVHGTDESLHKTIHRKRTKECWSEQNDSRV
jgi:hypothetical protein